MKCPFDALFIDRSMTVVGARERIAAHRVSRVFLSADGALELPPGTVGRTGTRVGDLIAFRAEIPR